MSERPWLIHNARSGREDLDRLELRRVLRPGRVFHVESREEMEAAVEEALDADPAWLAVAGGDGTIQAVVRLLGADAHLAVGPIPAGTGNDFVRGLEMPLDPIEAARAMVDGSDRYIDLMEVRIDGGEPVLAVNAVTLGLSGPVHSALTDELKERWGALAYLRAGLEASDRVEPIGAEVEVVPTPGPGSEPRRWSGRLLALAVANGRSAAGGVPIAPDADLDDGRLEVRGVSEGSWLEATAQLPQVFRGVEPDERWIVESPAAFRMELERPETVSIDGELVEARTLDVRVRPGALRLRIPAS